MLRVYFQLTETGTGRVMLCSMVPLTPIFPYSTCVKHKAYWLNTAHQAISCGPSTFPAAPSMSPPPPCLSSRQQRGQNSSAKSCASLCSCGEAHLCPHLSSEGNKTPPTDPAPLYASAAPSHLCLPSLSIQQTPGFRLQPLDFLLPSSAPSSNTR